MKESKISKCDYTKVNFLHIKTHRERQKLRQLADWEKYVQIKYLISNINIYMYIYISIHNDKHQQNSNTLSKMGIGNE